MPQTKIKYVVKKSDRTFPSIVFLDKNGFEKGILINNSYSSLDTSFEKIADAICDFLNKKQPDTIR